MRNHEEQDEANYGWICSRCDTAWSPYLDLCQVCNEVEDEKCLHTAEAQQDAILKNDRFFENLRGN